VPLFFQHSGAFNSPVQVSVLGFGDAF
jgi:hypothetical protein